MGAESRSHLLTTRASCGRCLSVSSLSPAHKGTRQCPAGTGAAPGPALGTGSSTSCSSLVSRKFRMTEAFVGKVGCGKLREE